jgi:hypothetical protein
MTNQQINIKIAELCEWKFKQMFLGEPYGIAPKEMAAKLDPAHWNRELYELPNYAADLNACCEFEIRLKKLGVFSSYLSHLAIVCGFNAQGDEAWFKLHSGLEAVCSATAIQKCEAFLRVHGQWEE